MPPGGGIHTIKMSHEVIRLAVMMYIRFPLSLRNVEDLLHERGIDICHETVRFWWGRFGPMRSYGAALKDLGRDDDREMGQWGNNRAENSHLPFRSRERAMLRFRRMQTLQKFASVHGSIYNHFTPRCCQGFKARLSDRDPVRGLHQGQRSHAPRQQAGHMTAPRKINRSSIQSLHKRSRPHMTAPFQGLHLATV